LIITDTSYTSYASADLLYSVENDYSSGSGNGNGYEIEYKMDLTCWCKTHRKHNKKYWRSYNMRIYIYFQLKPLLKPLLVKILVLIYIILESDTTKLLLQNCIQL